jgi:hypothetical protein
MNNMNYRIIGNDGKTYGPVNAEQIRLWIGQGRVESRTAIFVEGATDWTFIGLLPEFAGNFGTPPPTIGSLKSGTGQVKKTNAFAIWSLVCGALAWTCCCCCIPFNLLGAVFGIIALVQISAHSETQEGRSLAIAGLILAVTNLLWCFGLTLFDFATNQAKFIQNFN